MNRAIIGYHGRPETNWKPWLRDELVARGWRVEIPAMLNTDYPVADEWQAVLAETVGGSGFTGTFEKYTEGNHDTFFDHELNWDVIRQRCDAFAAIHSDDDPNVGFAQLDLFRRSVGAKTVPVHGMGHFGSPDGVFEVPVVRDEVVRLGSLGKS